MISAVPARITDWEGDITVPVEWSGVYAAGSVQELPLLECLPMCTAIFRSYTSDGFVIAADGLRLRAGDLTVSSESVQKIFSIEEHSRSLAYGLAGSVYIGGEAGAIFDFAVETRAAVQALRGRMPGDLTRYAELVANKVNQSLAERVRDGKLAQYPTCPNVEASGEPGSTIAYVYFLGYFGGNASWSDVRFWHEKQRLKSPAIYSERIRRGQLKVLGSAEVMRLLLYSDDPRFAEFRRPKPPRQEDLTLSEAVEIAKNYIRACSSDAGRQADENCKSIGGHLHVATVTPLDGFKWASGFEPLSPP